VNFEFSTQHKTLKTIQWTLYSQSFKTNRHI